MATTKLERTGVVMWSLEEELDYRECDIHGYIMNVQYNHLFYDKLKRIASSHSFLDRWSKIWSGRKKEVSVRIQMNRGSVR